MKHTTTTAQGSVPTTFSERYAEAIEKDPALAELYKTIYTIQKEKQADFDQHPYMWKQSPEHDLRLLESLVKALFKCDLNQADSSAWLCAILELTACLSACTKSRFNFQDNTYDHIFEHFSCLNASTLPNPNNRFSLSTEAQTAILKECIGLKHDFKKATHLLSHNEEQPDVALGVKKCLRLKRTCPILSQWITDYRAQIGQADIAHALQQLKAFDWNDASDWPAILRHCAIIGERAHWSTDTYPALNPKFATWKDFKTLKNKLAHRRITHQDCADLAHQPQGWSKLLQTLHGDVSPQPKSPTLDGCLDQAKSYLSTKQHEALSNHCDHDPQNAHQHFQAFRRPSNNKKSNKPWAKLLDDVKSIDTLKYHSTQTALKSLINQINDFQALQTLDPQKIQETSASITQTLKHEPKTQKSEANIEFWLIQLGQLCKTQPDEKLTPLGHELVGLRNQWVHHDPYTRSHMMPDIVKYYAGRIVQGEQLYRESRHNTCDTAPHPLPSAQLAPSAHTAIPQHENRASSRRRRHKNDTPPRAR